MAEASRLLLHEELCQILDYESVYFQPPASLLMSYPCIRYTRSGVDKRNANDKMYFKVNEYELVVIDPDPDTDIPDQLLEHFPSCRFVRHYRADNLNHYVLTLYY